MKNIELWSRLEAFQLDLPEAALPFSQRLARENQWSQGFAERVMEEYKKFLYLCLEAGHPVTPSDHVDQAWHLHIIYTRSYWHDLCRDTLGQEIHHGPTKGGRKEGEKFKDWYLLTMQSYEREFGQCPPSDIWPNARERFQSDFRRIDVRDKLILSRRKALAVSGCLVGSLALAGCVNDMSGETIGVLVILGLPLLAVLSLIASIAKGGSKTKRRGGAGRKGGSGVGGWWFFGGGCSHDDHNDSGCSSGCGSGCGGGGCGS
ncbi:glycine-rich domain-containing protein [Roseibacillus persicicus]|uniref:glycine-rich domain-containing protein n=1 Tax=Roseibacillus persicicus TaxID=454148 RepID=UPI00280FD9C5|nr:hypothetical protein [Roseibacillus persicicus]MDQ8190188.1 hypothetical protein [Roseibacillus persicicus]